MRWAARLASQAYRSPVLARLLFGVSVRRLGPEDHLFDVTTWVLARRALREISRETRVLDLGTGSAAILGLTFWKRRGCAVTSSDVDAAIVARAAANVARSGAPVRVVRSDFFEAVPEPFDVVTFNAPYVPSARGQALGLSRSLRSQWDGGTEGTGPAARFLEQLARRTGPLTAFLGINALHVPRDRVLALLRGQSALQLREVYRPRPLPVDVYVLDLGPVARRDSLS